MVRLLVLRWLPVLALAACGDVVSDPVATDAATDAAIGATTDGPAVPTTCSVTAQDCPGGYKCTYVVRGILVHGCRPLTGELQEGESCSGYDGADDCGPGLLCDEQLQTCVRFCDATSDCGSGDNCIWHRTGDGLCRTPCVLFDDSTCTTTTTCELGGSYEALSTTITYCRRTGTVAAGQSCNFFTTCQPDHSCLQGRCRPHCDDNHACPATACTLPDDVAFPNPTNAGACL